MKVNDCLDEYIKNEFYEKKQIISKNLVLEPCLTFYGNKMNYSDDAWRLASLMLKFTNDEIKDIVSDFFNYYLVGVFRKGEKSYRFRRAIDAVNWLIKLENSNVEEPRRLNFIIKEKISSKVIGLFSIRIYKVADKKNNNILVKNDSNIEEKDIGKEMIDDKLNKVLVQNKEYCLTYNMFLDPDCEGKFYDIEIFNSVCEIFCSLKDIIMATGIVVGQYRTFKSSIENQNEVEENFSYRKIGNCNVYFRKGRHKLVGNYLALFCLNFCREEFKYFFEAFFNSWEVTDFFDRCMGLDKVGNFFIISSQESGAASYLMNYLNDKQYVDEKAEFCRVKFEDMKNLSFSSC